MYLNNAAAIDFYCLTLLSLKENLISEIEHSNRISTLRELVAPGNRIIRALTSKSLVEPMSLNEKRIFHLRELETIEMANEEKKEQQFLSEDFSTNEIQNESLDNNLDRYSFTTKQKGRYDTFWRFHQNDADHKPSIPHGHSTQNKKVVLNPYTREVSEGGKLEEKKEKKQFIVKLWNNKDFRECAWENLTLHINDPRHKQVALRYKDELLEKTK
ncbi:hypothetical protein SAMN04487777_10734 [Priestia aryabhattai B8W22]|uniref:hypothetical protein n=1 Tax=Priestia aryabhattai TaxID=412384 RepID=UPI000892729A|nr:hypothetical protein SAMN04487777_10734 [Priestia aryabhattai B8W22]